MALGLSPLNSACLATSDKMRGRLKILQNEAVSKDLAKIYTLRLDIMCENAILASVFGSSGLLRAMQNGCVLQALLFARAMCQE